MPALLAIPDAVAEIVASCLTMADVAALQGAHPRFRKAFMVVKNIKYRLRRTMVFCKMLLPVVLHSNWSPSGDNPPRRALGAIRRLEIAGMGVNCSVGPVKAIRSLTFAAANFPMYKHITATLQTLRIETWSIAPLQVAMTRHVLSALDRVETLAVLEIDDWRDDPDKLLQHPCVCDLQTLALTNLQEPISLRLLPLGLKKLDLFGCKITDIGPLARLLRLEKLNLAYTNITDTSTPGGTCNTLAQLPRLVSLDLQDCDIRDIAPLAAKTWRFLNLHSTDISSVDVLQNTRIRCLHVSTTHGLCILTGVRKLDVSVGEKIRLAGAKGIRHLRLSSGEVSIGDLAQLSSLVSLALVSTKFDDSAETLRGLRGLPDLRELVLREFVGRPVVMRFMSIELPPTLRYLCMDSVASGRIDFDAVAQTIETLVICDCRKLTGTIRTERCPKLSSLTVRGSPSITVRSLMTRV
jgi:hypothetical protein